jgi:hypothetical protein
MNGLFPTPPGIGTKCRVVVCGLVTRNNLLDYLPVQLECLILKW